MAQIVDLEHKGNLSGATDAQLAEHANEIRRLHKRTIDDIIEIGKHLIQAKALCGHGNWRSWLEREFDWSERTARNYMAVAGRSKSATIADLNIDATALLQLTAPSTPPEVIQDVAALGRKITAKDVAKAKAAHKPAEVEHKPAEVERAPVPLKLKLVAKTTSAERDPKVLASDKVITPLADARFRSATEVATVLGVAVAEVPEALKTVENCVVTNRRRKDGVLEYAIPAAVADLRRTVVEQAAEIIALRARLAELAVENERLMAMATAPSLASAH